MTDKQQPVYLRAPAFARGGGVGCLYLKFWNLRQLCLLDVTGIALDRRKLYV